MWLALRNLQQNYEHRETLSKVDSTLIAMVQLHMKCFKIDEKTSTTSLESQL